MKWEPLAAAGALLAITIVAHAPAFDAGYVVDDEEYVVENALLHDATGLQRIWVEPGATSQYYPLVFTSFWLEYQLWGTEPVGYHAVNVALHAVNVLLVWVLLARLGLPCAWLGAALFGVHPVNVESVAWVAERKNVLSAAFYFLSLLTFLRWRPLSPEPGQAGDRTGLYLLSLALFLLALLSKTATVTLPAAILVLIWWKRGRVASPDALAVAPMFAMAFVLGLVTLRLETTSVGATGALWDLSPLERVLIAGRALWFYASTLAWPSGLAFDYGRWNVDTGAAWQYLYPLAALAVVAASWSLRHRLGRGALAAVLLYAGTLAPTLGFLSVAFFRYSFVANHFHYIASVVLLAAAAACAARLLARASTPTARRCAHLGVALALALLGALSWQQARAYESLETLCRHTLARSPTSWLANNILGEMHLRRGEAERALPYLEAARQAGPDYFETLVNLAIAYMNLARYDESIAQARHAVEVAPSQPDGYRHVADALQRSGRPGQAIPWYRQALERDPDSVGSLVGLGSALARAGRAEDAIPLLEAALLADARSVAALSNLGIALASVGRFTEAAARFEAALRIEPGNATVARNLDLARRRAGDAAAGP